MWAVSGLLPLLYLLQFVALGFALWASIKVSWVLKRYKKVANSLGLTGAGLVQSLAKRLGINVTVSEGKGWLVDYFNPRNDEIVLSSDIYRGNSIAAIGVAAHEFGHALQKASRYPFLIIRNTMVPIVKWGSNVGYLAIFLGFILNSLGLAKFGVVLMFTLVLFSLLTLPVEFDASKRALKLLEKELGLPEEELKKVNRVLKAAALTYVAAFISTLIEFLYYAVLVFSRGDD